MTEMLKDERGGGEIISHYEWRERGYTTERGVGGEHGGAARVQLVQNCLQHSQDLKKKKL